jgi:hypothetical protein
VAFHKFSLNKKLCFKTVGFVLLCNYLRRNLLGQGQYREMAPRSVDRFWESLSSCFTHNNPMQNSTAQQLIPYDSNMIIITSMQIITISRICPKSMICEVLSTKLSINTTAKPVWLLNGILSMRELMQKHVEILAKSWQLDKSKTNPLSLLGL